MSSAPRKLIAGSDFLNLATLLALLPIAVLLPVQLWVNACRFYARLASPLRFGRLAKTAQTLAALQCDSSIDADNGYRQCLEMMFESRLQVVDQSLFNRAVPRVAVNGARHIERALDEGRGVVLMTTPSAFSDLVVKIGLSQAGFRVAQLSRPEHGFSDSAVGIATLNRLRTRIEDRFLDQRVHIDSGLEKTAMLALNRILKGNGIVNVTVGSKTRRPETLSIRGSTMPIATGPIRLAKLTGAALIPIFGARSGEMTYVVDVEPQMDLCDKEPDEVLGRYAELLDQYLVRYPYQCRGFSALRMNGPTSSS